MSDMKWWYSCDAESYHGPYELREQAIEDGRDAYGGGRFCVLEAAQTPIDLAKYFDADDWLTRLEENELEELRNPDGPALLESVDKVGFQEAVRAAIAKWQADTNTVITPWMFTSQGNKEWFNTDKDSSHE